MNGPIKAQANRPGRRAVPAASSCRTGRHGLYRAIRACRAPLVGHSPAAFSVEQRQVDRLYEVPRTARMDEQRHHNPRPPGIGRRWLSVRDKKRHASQPGGMVCRNVGIPRLDARNGRRGEKFSAWSLCPERASENASSTPSAGVESEVIAPPHGVSALPSTPSAGAMRSLFRTSLTPPDGAYLDLPSAQEFWKEGNP